MEPIPEKVATPVPDKEPVLLPPAPVGGLRDCEKNAFFYWFLLPEKP